jgi:hypothetical protein
MLIKKFKFFEGIINNVYVDFGNSPDIFLQTERLMLRSIFEEEIINELSRNISDAIDNEIITRLTENYGGDQRV